MPNYEITSPDGKRFQITAPDGATQEQVLAYAQSQFAGQAGAQQGSAAPQRLGTGKSYDTAEDGSLVPSRSDYGPERELDKWFQAGKNVLQGAGQFATGITGSIAGDVAGLGALAYDATANFVTDPLGGGDPGRFADSAAVRDRVSNALTYRAADQDSLTNKVLQAPGKIIGGAGEFLGEQAEKTGIPYIDHIARAIPLAAANFAGVKAAKAPAFNAKPFGGAARQPIPERVPGTPAPPAPAATPEQLAIKNATDLGLKLQPSTVGNKVGNVVEGMAGRAPLARSLSMKNAQAVDAAAGKAVGIAGKPVNRVTIGIERNKANQAYDKIAKTGRREVSDAYREEITGIDDRSGGGSFADDAPPAVANLKKIYGSQKAFDAGDAVARIKKLRADARGNFKTRDPDKMAVANVQQKIADALDNELERHADALGQPELAANYKAARVQLAKLRTVEEALAGNSVSAKKIWQQWKRGAPLQGELLAIAKAYDNFPQVLQDANKLVGTHPFSAVDYLVAGAGSAAGVTANPALLATVAARPAARAALASDFYQRNFVRGKGAAAQKAVKPAKPTAVPAAAAQQRERKAG